MSSNSSNAPHSAKKPFWYRVGMSAGVIGWVAFGFALAQAIGFLVIFGLSQAGVQLDQINQSVFSTVVSIVVYTLALVIIIGVPQRIRRWRTTRYELGIAKAPKWMDGIWLITAIFVYLILTVSITALAMYVFPSANYAQKQEIGFEALSQSWEYILAFVSLVIIAPLAEELIFRGYLFGKLKKYAAVWVAVLLSAALFAVAHGQWNVALDTFALGLVLASLRLITGNIWVSMALHALKNGLAFYFLFVNPIVL